mmetsp:Transcript_68019/g.215161  ORF Transcript_68019/g.215161 Transcript_68019/m.215161 type:complete len:637 (-) Transcript_68019:27-1937(-)
MPTALLMSRENVMNDRAAPRSLKKGGGGRPSTTPNGGYTFGLGALPAIESEPSRESLGVKGKRGGARQGAGEAAPRRGHRSSLVSPSLSSPGTTLARREMPDIRARSTTPTMMGLGHSSGYGAGAIVPRSKTPSVLLPGSASMPILPVPALPKNLEVYNGPSEAKQCEVLGAYIRGLRGEASLIKLSEHKKRMQLAEQKEQLERLKEIAAYQGDDSKEEEKIAFIGRLQGTKDVELLELLVWQDTLRAMVVRIRADRRAAELKHSAVAADHRDVLREHEERMLAQAKALGEQHAAEQELAARRAEHVHLQAQREKELEWLRGQLEVAEASAKQKQRQMSKRKIIAQDMKKVEAQKLRDRTRRQAKQSVLMSLFGGDEDLAAAAEAETAGGEGRRPSLGFGPGAGGSVGTKELLYLKAAQKIRERTGVSDPAEMVRRISNREHSRKQLVAQRQERMATLEGMGQEKERLIKAKRDIEFSGMEPGATREIMDNVERAIVYAERRASMRGGEYERSQDLLLPVFIGVDSLIERVLVTCHTNQLDRDDESGKLITRKVEDLDTPLESVVTRALQEAGQEAYALAVSVRGVEMTTEEKAKLDGLWARAGRGLVEATTSRVGLVSELLEKMMVQASFVNPKP